MASDLLNSDLILLLRDVFYRLVFRLHLDASLSMKMVSFWLWLEGSGHAGFLERIDLLDDNHFSAIAFAAQSFAETLNLDCCSGDLGGGRSMPRSRFQEEVIEGISFYLSKVCCLLLLEDLPGKKEMEQCSHQICRAYEGKMNDHVPVSTKDLLSKIRSLYGNSTQEHHHQEEGPSYRRSHQYPRNHILQDRKVAVDEYALTSHLSALLDTLSLRDQKQHDSAVRVMRQPYDVPEDERTLFVTFSNGYPLSKSELYDFFMRHYGDVEDITIEEPPEPRPPLFAQVVFFSQLTLLRVLDGNKRVKFMTRGKHVWARQYVPKKKSKNDEAN